MEYLPIYLKDLNIELTKLTILDLCKALKQEQSKSNLRKLIVAGGVKLNSQKILDPFAIINTLVQETFNLKIGKRGCYKIIIN